MEVLVVFGLVLCSQPVSGSVSAVSLLLLNGKITRRRVVEIPPMREENEYARQQDDRNNTATVSARVTGLREGRAKDRYRMDACGQCKWSNVHKYLSESRHMEN
jgi:hypothetical protein